MQPVLLKTLRGTDDGIKAKRFSGPPPVRRYERCELVDYMPIACILILRSRCMSII